MSRQHSINRPHLLWSVSAALLVLSVGATAQRFVPSPVPVRNRRS